MVDVQDLLRLAQERGYVTSEEIMALVEEYDLTTEEIKDLYSQLFEMASEIDEQSRAITGTLEPTKPALDLSIDTLTGDPLQLYLQEAGQSLCSPRTRRSSSPSASRPATSRPRTA